MFQLLRSITRQQVVIRQLPAFATAFVIAGTFYRFHSFYLESIAFLATWFVIDAIFEGLGWVYAKATARVP